MQNWDNLPVWVKESEFRFGGRLLYLEALFNSGLPFEIIWDVEPCKPYTYEVKVTVTLTFLKHVLHFSGILPDGACLSEGIVLQEEIISFQELAAFSDDELLHVLANRARAKKVKLKMKQTKKYKELTVMLAQLKQKFLEVA
jgi:hypothetical protein